MDNPIKTAVFTIVSLNYCAYAKTLMESVKTVHPEWQRHVLLVDRCADQEVVGGELFATLTVEQLPLPKMREFLFRYGIMELNTAVKPWMFAYLRRQGYQRVVYLDPDILVVNRLIDIERLLDEGIAVVVTPHLTAPIDDGCHPSELDIMRSGAYNLGFMAIAGVPAADAFIDWWQDKLEFGAVSDPDRGLFTDQKWVDLAPGMFGNFAILRDAGYNVAYWNLPHRQITRQGEVWMADDRPLRFFHFSGFDPLNPKPFSKHQNRLSLDTIGAARALALDYAARVLSHGHAHYRALPYAFGTFEDGTPIPAAIRALYRENSDVRDQAGENPFARPALFVQGEAGGIPMMLRGLWLQHQHLQRAFPDPLGRNREDYFRWFAAGGGAELEVPEAFVRPISRALSTRLNLGADRWNAVKPGGSSIWTRILIFMHRRVTGGVLGTARLLQYQNVSGPLEFLRVGFEQFRASRWGRRLGLALPAGARIDPLQSCYSSASCTQAVSGAVACWRTARYSGLHAEPGKDAWWVGRQASFLVDRFTTTDLRLRGTHVGALHQFAHGKAELNISVALDDEPTRVVTVAPGHFDVSIDLGKLPEKWPVTLKLVPEASCVPSELGLSDDNRRLSVQLASIDIGDVNVFSAAGRSKTNRETFPGIPGVNVVGYARSEHGLGQSLRHFVGALDAAAIPNVVIDFNNNNHSRIEDHSLEERIVVDPVHAINVFHINADQMPAAEMHLPAHLFGRFNIGFWHWELPEMLEEHLAGFHCLNEIWVPTAFVQDAVSKRSPVPVVRIPHAIHFSVSPDANRARFGLPEDKFLFLMMYDFSSYQERKNPQAALEAFDRAFQRKGSEAMLVIKTQNAEFHKKDVDALRARLSGRNNVVWINETLTRQQVYDLQAVCDALVSLHRSEGFGLGPAEAMFLGKPVIATNWSGNTEFMRPQNSLPVNYRLVKIEKDIGVYQAGQTWAEPDVEHAARLMREVVDDSGLRARIAEEAKRTVREEFSPAVIGKKIRARLAYVHDVLIAN